MKLKQAVQNGALNLAIAAGMAVHGANAQPAFHPNDGLNQAAAKQQGDAEGRKEADDAMTWAVPLGAFLGGGATAWFAMFKRTGRRRRPDATFGERVGDMAAGAARKVLLVSIAGVSGAAVGGATVGTAVWLEKRGSHSALVQAEHRTKVRTTTGDDPAAPLQGAHPIATPLTAPVGASPGAAAPAAAGYADASGFQGGAANDGQVTPDSLNLGTDPLAIQRNAVEMLKRLEAQKDQ